MMYTEEEINVITLSGISELSYKTSKILLDDFKATSPDFEKHGNYLIKTLSGGVYNKVKAKFYDPSFRAEMFGGLDVRGIECVTYFSKLYPDCLNNIRDPPLFLYCKGDTRLLGSECFSIVGARKSTPKMRDDCKNFSARLSEKFTIVSGLAEGADAAALEGALDAGGRVISVLANGFDRIYPPSNVNLYGRVAEHGLAVTEYRPEVPARDYHFRVRNRIIAGLSRGTLVASAAERSGALITANLAADYGRDVFAFPHSVGTGLGAGCNKLIKNGANLADNILDIFRFYGLDLLECEKVALTADEDAVYERLRLTGEAHLTELAQAVDKQPRELVLILSALEIKGLVKNAGGNRYCAAR